MSQLHRHHIIDVFCVVDDLLVPDSPRTGRPAKLVASEIVTILIWNSLMIQSKTLRGIYNHIQTYHDTDFNLPAYSKFVAAAHRALPQLLCVLDSTLSHTESVRLVDATMLPVCKHHRADTHKVAKDIAHFGKNWQGWHYGFKLHASVSLDGKLCGLTLTSANVYDAQALPGILNEHCDIAVGDTLYGASVMRSIIHKQYGTCIITPPWPKQKQKLATQKQLDLLDARSKIECVFDYLKEHLHLVSSFPRSVTGYVLHYVRVLVGYQFRWVV